MSSTGQLTERVIDALEPKPGAQYVRWDGKLPGFGVRVSPAGAKTFVYKYRLKSGRVRWATLGRAGSVTLDRARTQAKHMVGDVAEGKDPLKEVDRARGAVTLAERADHFLEHIDANKKRPTARLYRLAINGHIKPWLGAIPIADISADDALRLHQRLRGTPIMANRVLAVLSSLLAWCSKERGQAPNPCYGIRKYAEKKRRRYLDTREYARLGKALRATAMAPAPKTAIELLLLTGARPDEIASLQWAHVDLRRGLLDLPDSKTGAKVIHLAPPAVRLLKKWPRVAGVPYVFPGVGRDGKAVHIHATTLAHAWAELREEASLENVRLYDACRHSYASVAISRHGLSLAQIGEQLGHSQPATTARYAHLHDDVARSHAESIGGTIAAALKRRVR